MITASYAEVLDATKHQDDKIGQLLTSISFLTAAALALAALESSNFLTRPIAVTPYQLPLALIALVAFLAGVAWSVMLLLLSLSTPLRVPGLTRSRRSNPTKWVRDIRASQIYFYEISKISVDQWEDKWSAPAEDLKRERFSSLVRETHNLGVRTSAKYDRTTEAVAVLSFSLLAFALSIIYVAIAVATPASAHTIVLNWWQRLIVAWIFGCYAWLQTLGQIRYNRQAVDEAPAIDVKSPERRKSRAEICYAVVIGLLMIDILEYDRSWPGLGAWIAITVILVLCYLGAFLFTSSKPRPVREILATVVDMVVDAYKTFKAVRTAGKGAKTTLLRAWWHDHGGRLLIMLATVALTIATICCGINDWYAGQLAVASLAMLLIIGSAILQPTLMARRSRQLYWDDLRNASPSAPSSQPGQPVPPAQP